MKRRLKIGAAATVVAIALGGWLILTQGHPGETGAANAAEINLPKLTPIAQNGKVAFDANCAACHGENGAGSKEGPPLIHKIYEPGHHGDQAFWLAARNGVRSHHWRYGNMPAVEGVSDNQIKWIVKYIREIQAANGIN